MRTGRPPIWPRVWTDAPRSSSVYAIVHLPTGRKYVGSAVDTLARWRLHLSQLMRSKHPNIRLQRAWNRYGHEAFEWLVLEVINDPVMLISREQHWINQEHAIERGFNSCPAAGSRLGSVVTEETKRKISLSNKGRKLHLDTIARIAASHLGVSPRLNKSQVSVIKMRLLKGESHQSIYSDYSVSRSTITAIALGDNWSHVIPAEEENGLAPL